MNTPSIRPKTVVTQRLTARSATHARTEIAVRDLNVVIDEPTERGGTNEGATPTETLPIALAGCLNVIGHRVADHLDIEIQDMSLEIETKFDRRGVTLEQALDVPFPEMTVNILITTAASDDDVDRLKDGVRKYCPLSNVIRQSGTALHENWTVVRP